jgi:hypothetical protein
MLVGTVASAAGTLRGAAVEVGAQAAVPTAPVEVEAPVGAAALTGVEAPVQAAVVVVVAAAAGAITKVTGEARATLGGRAGAFP